MLQFSIYVTINYLNNLLSPSNCCVSFHLPCMCMCSQPIHLLIILSYQLKIYMYQQ